MRTHARKLAIAAIGFATVLAPATSNAWWNKEWSGRKAFTIDASPEGGDIKDPVGDTVVLLRLHQGNFQFASAAGDGSDLRFVAEDDKTVLPHQVERFDSLMNEAFVWVRVPGVKPAAKTSIWLYYGHTGGEAQPVDAKAVFGDDTMLDYHFAEKGVPPVDSSKNGNTAGTPGTASEGSMVGSGARFLGENFIEIPGSDSLAWASGGTMTWSAWVKPGSVDAAGVLFAREEEGRFLRIGIEGGVPYAEMGDGSKTARSPAGKAVSAGIWMHLAVVTEGSKATLYTDGETAGSFDASLPALKSGARLGAGMAGAGGFIGELDELNISNAAWPAGKVKLAAIGQSGTDRANKLIVAGEDEGGEGGGHNEIAEHLSLFGEISKSLTFDGWAVIVLCAAMALIGWFVAFRKFIYLNRIKQGADEFLKMWSHVRTDLTQLDHTDAKSIKSLGGNADEKVQKLMRQSPLYHIYHIGSEEISHRMQTTKSGFVGLSARSIQAIRASLDGGLSREVRSLNGDLVFLTISIAGGPYLGLLGTVVGVMITFATIARTGEVEVNSIAPGIAGALLATVAGLIVAIPALFIYSYLASRIKDAVGTMQDFIEEFISKMAEFYPEAK